MKPVGHSFEMKKFKQGFAVVVGADEVGRGALAGPIVAAAVAVNAASFHKKFLDWQKDIKDSKLLSPARREKLAFHIKQNSLAWSIAAVGPGIIDKINIHQANLLVLHQTVKRLHGRVEALSVLDSGHKAGLRSNSKPHSYSSSESARLVSRQARQASREGAEQTHVFIDGRFILPNWQGSQEAVVDGDAKVFSIAAASIIAKVYRDRLMMKLEPRFPGYEFAKHKGYGTLAHRRAIERLGLSKMHRKTFCQTIDVSQTKPV